MIDRLNILAMLFEHRFWWASSTRSAVAGRRTNLSAWRDPWNRSPSTRRRSWSAVSIDVAATLARTKRQAAPYFAALGLLLNRAPLYAGPETVVSPDLVEHAYSVFRGFDWAEPELLELQTLFLRAARVVGDRGLDVAVRLRHQTADKLAKSGVPQLITAKIRGFVPRQNCGEVEPKAVDVHLANPVAQETRMDPADGSGRSGRRRAGARP